MQTEYKQFFLLWTSMLFSDFKKSTEFQIFVKICNECVLYSSNYVLNLNRKCIEKLTLLIILQIGSRIIMFDCSIFKLLVWNTVGTELFTNVECGYR